MTTLEPTITYQSFSPNPENVNKNVDFVNSFVSQGKNILSKPLTSTDTLSFWKARKTLSKNVVTLPVRSICQTVASVEFILETAVATILDAFKTLGIAWKYCTQSFVKYEKEYTWKQVDHVKDCYDKKSVSGNAKQCLSDLGSIFNQIGGSLNSIPRIIVQELRILGGFINSDLAINTLNKTKNENTKNEKPTFSKNN